MYKRQEKFRLVAAIEKCHEERYRALLKNIELAEVFAKSEVSVWAVSYTHLTEHIDDIIEDLEKGFQAVGGRNHV